MMYEKGISAKIRVKCVVVFLNIVVGGKYFRHTLAIHFSKINMESSSKNRVVQ